MAIISKIVNNYYDKDCDVMVTESQIRLFRFIVLSESVATTTRQDFIKLFQSENKKKLKKIGYVVSKKTKKTKN